MFKKEKKCIVLLSIIVIGIFLILKNSSSMYLISYFVILPLYLCVIRCINNRSQSRENVDLAVNCCLNESEFNVIDKVEKLRSFFHDTQDVVRYLTIVESRVLTFIFDDENIKLSFNEYFMGAIKCLCIFKNYNGIVRLNVDVITLPHNDKIPTVLSALYMVSKQIDMGSSSLNIISKQKNDSIDIDVFDQDKNRLDDKFCKKILTIFSNGQLALKKIL